MEFHPLDVLYDNIETLLDGVWTAQNGKVVVAQLQQLGEENESLNI